jgi:hypothetical protein
METFDGSPAFPIPHPPPKNTIVARHCGDGLDIVWICRNFTALRKKGIDICGVAIVDGTITVESTEIVDEMITREKKMVIKGVTVEDDETVVDDDGVVIDESTDPDSFHVTLEDL